ncbi:hypothetical protein JB92DRAFT_3003213 [Gautieria morchelliformis]|nr:hypothetical protein JB92DRAFT_3003213 [Gautieria morchelliformis]
MQFCRLPKQRYQISKCDTCPASPSSVPTSQACLDPPGTPPNPVKPLEHPTPSTSQSSSTKPPANGSPSFPANVSLYDPASRCLYGRFTNQIQPLPSPIPSTSPKPKTTATPPGGSPTKHSTILLMVYPESHRPTIRGGKRFDLIHHTRLLSALTPHLSAPYSPSASQPTGGSQRGSAQILIQHGHRGKPCTRAAPNRARGGRQLPPRPIRNCPVPSTNIKNNNTTERDPQAAGSITPAAAIHTRAVSNSPCRIRPRTYAGCGT